MPLHHQRRPRKLETRCAVGFFLFLFSLVAWFSAMALARYVNPAVGGLVALFVVVPAWVCSFIFAIFGWKQLAKFSGRYTDTSKLFATLTFALDGMAGLILVPMMIFSFCRGIDYARAQSARHHTYAESASLEIKDQDFKDPNFVFHLPGAPWQRVRSSDFGPNVNFAICRRDPLTAFTIIKQQQRAGIVVLDPRGDMVRAFKISLRRGGESRRIVDEKEVIYNGMAGWQVESEGVLEGHETYWVQWIFAKNGFGYLLSTWAPSTAKSQLKEEAGRLFAGFELTQAQPGTATSP